MILSTITWSDYEGEEYLTCEISIDKKEAWASIDKARKIKPKHEILEIEFFRVKGSHFD